ncbi:MAG: hypothetical protein ACREBS_02905 [Nitrososphaerales archaeon]
MDSDYEYCEVCDYVIVEYDETTIGRQSGKKVHRSCATSEALAL